MGGRRREELETLQQAEFLSFGNHFGGIFGVEVVQKAPPVPFDSGKREVEFIGNLGAGELCGQKGQDFPLTVRQLAVFF